jgi:hypothetical protein
MEEQMSRWTHRETVADGLTKGLFTTTQKFLKDKNNTQHRLLLISLLKNDYYHLKSAVLS